jgi:transglutaminase/protease-like cytokinesis protein 3
MKIYLILAFILFNCFAIAQNKQSPDQFAIHIPDSVSSSAVGLAKIIRSNYPDDEDFVRTLYVWICTNMSFDYHINDSFKNENLVEYALKTKSGKCKNFSAVLTSLCNMVGIEAYSILGYVRIDGNVQTDRDHAWNIIKIDGEFYLFDPTFDKLAKSFDSETGTYNFVWFKKQGSEFIPTHMPYDPMMQLLDYPIKHKEFFKMKLSGKKYFDYKLALQEYQSLDDKEQLKNLLTRAEKYGLEIKELEFLCRRLRVFVEKNTQ